MDFILVHIGRKPVPKFVEVCVSQIEKFGHRVHFLKDSLDDVPKIRKFNERSLYKDTNSILQDFWIVTAKRFFVIEQYMKDNNLKNVIHLENDNLIYCNFDEYEEIFKDHYKDRLGLGAVSEKSLGAGVMYIDSYSSPFLTTILCVNSFCDTKPMTKALKPCAPGTYV